MDIPVGTCCEQDVLEANGFAQGIKSEYFRVWVRLPSTLATNFSSDHNSFQMLWEWKTNNHLRTATNIINSGGTIGGWEMQIDTRGRNCDGGGTTGGYIDPNTGATVFNCSQVWSDGFNTGVAVPLNQWFLYEIYNKRSVGNDGTTKMAVNGQIIHEQIGPNYGLNLEEIANAYLMNMYGQASEEWWLDDIEIRDSLPTGCSAFPCGANETGSSTASAAVPFMTSPRGAIGVVGQPFSYQVTASPTPTSYSVFNLPSGLSLNTSTGLISGTPTAAGRYAAVSIHVKNSFGETVHASVFQINSASSPAPTIGSFTASPSSITAGQPAQLQWTQSNAATLTLNPGNVNVSGQDPFPVTPVTTTTYTLTASNSAGTATATVTVNVAGSTGPRTFFASFSGGADTNTGTDTAHPWKTLAKVTAGPTGGYVPGDSISFKKGDTWTSATLTTHNAGTAALPIVYTNYGTGALPILDGGGVSTLMNINHNFITVTGLQFQNAGTFINFAGMDGTTITGNTMLNATNHFIFAGGAIAGTTVITGNTLTAQAGHAGGNNSIEIWADPRQNKSYTVSDNDIERHLSNSPNANCIVLAGASNVLIERNICRGGTQGPGVKPYQHPEAQTCDGVSKTGCNCLSGDPGTNNIKIRGNYIDNIKTANNGDGELIEGEGCPTAGTGGDQTNLEVAYNHLICVSGGVGVGSSDAIGAYHNNGYDIHGNVILGGCQSGWPANQSPTSSPGMIRINAASTNVHVYNNTLVGGMPAGDARPQHGIGFFPGSSGTAENNILKNLNTGVLCSQCGTVTADHNLFDTDVVRNSNTGITDAGNNLNTSPMFVNGSMITSANDVKLQPGSPAIQSGATLGTAYKFVLDPAGVGPFLYTGTFDQSAGWMRGAFGISASALKVFTIRGAVMSGAKTQ
jgi:hypothetical protein